MKVSLVMPGHIGTSIVINSGKILGRDPNDMPEGELEQARLRLARLGFDLPADLTTDQLQQGLVQRGEEFRDDAPMTASEAARVILDGVRSDS